MLALGKLGAMHELMPVCAGSRLRHGPYASRNLTASPSHIALSMLQPPSQRIVIQTNYLLQATSLSLCSLHRAMSEHIIRLRQSQPLPLSDAKETALQAVLRGAMNKVLWDECQLIWDSRSLIDDTATSEDQVRKPFSLAGVLYWQNM